MVSKKEKLKLREQAERVKARKEMEDNVKRISIVSTLREILLDRKGNNNNNNKKNNKDIKTTVRELISSIDDVGSEGRYLALQILVRDDSYSDAKDIIATMMTKNEINEDGCYVEKENENNNIDVRNIILWSFASSGKWEQALPFASQVFIDQKDQNEIDNGYFTSDTQHNHLRQLAIQVFSNAKVDVKDTTKTNIQNALEIFQPTRDLPMINDILEVIIRKGTSKDFETLWNKIESSSSIEEVGQDTWKLVYEYGVRFNDPLMMETAIDRMGIEELDVSELTSMLKKKLSTIPQNVPFEPDIQTKVTSLIELIAKKSKKAKKDDLPDAELVSQVLGGFDDPEKVGELIVSFQTIFKNDNTWMTRVLPEVKSEKIFPYLIEADDLEQAWVVFKSMVNTKNEDRIRKFLNEQSSSGVYTKLMCLCFRLRIDD